MHVERTKALVTFLQALPDDAFESEDTLAEVFNFTPGQAQIMDKIKHASKGTHEVADTLLQLLNEQEKCHDATTV